MDIQALSRSIVATGFSIASSIADTCSYVQNSVAYNTSTGAVTKTPTTTSVSVIFVDFDIQQTNGDSVRMGDELALIKAVQLDGVTPSMDDVITQTGVADRQILSWEKDPADSLFKFHVRKKAN